jgi:hypothetical protein
MIIISLIIIISAIIIYLLTPKSKIIPLEPEKSFIEIMLDEMFTPDENILQK